MAAMTAAAYAWAVERWLYALLVLFVLGLVVLSVVLLIIPPR
jgi:hypothetical protein